MLQPVTPICSPPGRAAEFPLCCPLTVACVTFTSPCAPVPSCGFHLQYVSLVTKGAGPLLVSICHWDALHGEVPVHVFGPFDLDPRPPCRDALRAPGLSPRSARALHTGSPVLWRPFPSPGGVRWRKVALLFKMSSCRRPMPFPGFTCSV